MMTNTKTYHFSEYCLRVHKDDDRTVIEIGGADDKFTVSLSPDATARLIEALQHTLSSGTNAETPLPHLSGSQSVGDPLVNHPPHYTHGRKFESIDVLMDWFPTDPLLWQTVKYLARYGRKGGPEDWRRDLEKAKWYLEKKMEGK